MDLDCFNIFSALLRERHIPKRKEFSTPKPFAESTEKKPEEKVKEKAVLEEKTNRFAAEVSILAQNYPDLAKALELKRPYRLILPLSKIFGLIPRSKKSIDRYNSLTNYLASIGIELVITSSRTKIEEV